MKDMSPLVLHAIGHRRRTTSKISLRKAPPTYCIIALIIFFALPLISSAQLAPNQTNGFGNGRLVTFTYLQNFDCVDQPTMDLDFNHIMAQSDPNEMQTPICQPVTEPTDQSGI